MKFGTLSQVKKTEAIQRFNDGKPIMIAGSNQNPVGMMPGYVLSSHSIVGWKEHANCYKPDGNLPDNQLWKGDVNTTAWELMINNFMAYLESELGRYPVFYVDSEWEKESA